jgi:hypothetical protein
MESLRLLWLIFALPALAGCGPGATGDTTLDGGSNTVDGGSNTVVNGLLGTGEGPGGDGGGPTGESGSGDTDAGAIATCASNADCAQREFCKKTGCGDPSGVCSPAPTDSTCEKEPAAETCGCDHTTYPSACWAAANGTNVFAEGQCVLPSGPCTSQSDCGGDGYAKAVFCAPSACGQAAGTCTRIPEACDFILDQVCGCDGRTYYNACFARMTPVTVAYGGPCRSGAITPCNGPAACTSGQACVGGVCLASSDEGCGGDGVCGGINSPRTQECVASACAEGTCSTCIFTTAVACGPDVGCPAGQLCVPSTAPSGGSFCVVP